MKKVKIFVKDIKEAYKADDYRRGELVGVVKGGIAAIGGFIIGRMITGRNK